MIDDHTGPKLGASALVTIDVQHDVLDGQPLEVPGTSAVLPAVSALTAAYRRASQPIVHMVRLYRRDGQDVDRCRRALVESGSSVLLAGSPGSQLAPGVGPDPTPALDVGTLLSGGVQSLGPAEVVVYKPRWGAFYRTPLADHLGALGVTTLVFCGCNFPNCPRTSVYEASERDFRLVLVEDAVSGLYQQGAEELAGIGVALMPARQIVGSIGSA